MSVQAYTIVMLSIALVAALACWLIEWRHGKDMDEFYNEANQGWHDALDGWDESNRLLAEYADIIRTIMRDSPAVTKTGKILTDEDIQALADEAERGYDVSHLTRKDAP